MKGSDRSINYLACNHLPPPTLALGVKVARTLLSPVPTYSICTVKSALQLFLIPMHARSFLRRRVATRKVFVPRYILGMQILLSIAHLLQKAQLSKREKPRNWSNAFSCVSDAKFLLDSQDPMMDLLPFLLLLIGGDDTRPRASGQSSSHTNTQRGWSEKKVVFYLSLGRLVV